MTLALILAMAALSLLTLLALIWSVWPAWLKAILVVAVTSFYFVAYELVQQLGGTPSHSPLPERFVLIGAVVEEPSSKSQGAVYLWVNELSDARPVVAPRAYQVEYSKALHTEVDEGMRRGREGVRQLGTVESAKAAQRGILGLLGLARSADKAQIHIRDLPASQLPEK